MEFVKSHRHSLLSVFPCLLFVLSACSKGGSPSSSAPLDAGLLRSQGAVLYRQNCATCHLAGEGTNFFPKLRGSAIVAGDPPALIEVILKGRRGESEIDGKKINGIMPAQAYLNDFEVAAICSYIRKEFGGVEDTVQPAQVRTLRP